MIHNLLVTVFVPVYNGEKYLNETLTSIQNQTYKNIEVLLVDDSSTDGSKIIIDKFADKDSRFKVFEKINGGMTSVSWNFIKPEIKGDYLFYSSQDDIFSIDLIEKMVERQNETNADSILPDMEYYYENKQNNEKIIGLNGDRAVVLSGKKACEETLNWNIHGFALIKSSLIKEEYFFEDAFDSDDFITRKLFFKSNKVVFCKGVFYYRQDNFNAITKTFTTKNFYTLTTQFRLYDFFNQNKFDIGQVLSVKYSLLHSYIHMLAIFQLYDFETEIEKERITLYLSNFRKTHFTNRFYFSNISAVIALFKIKHILILLIYQTPFLFQFMIKKQLKKLQKNK